MYAPNASQAIDAAWTAVRFILSVAINIFGPPAELAASHFVSRGLRREIVAWLRPAEVLVRTLLAMRAAALVAQEREGLLANAKALRRGRAKLKPKEHPSLRAEDSSKWRNIRFVLVPPAPLWFRERRARGAEPRATLVTGIALAERFEALIRVIHRPEPAARRLARRLVKAPKIAVATLARMRAALPDKASNPARVALQGLAPLMDDVLGYFSSA